jgi:hypothetical protein
MEIKEEILDSCKLQLLLPHRVNPSLTIQSPSEGIVRMNELR